MEEMSVNYISQGYSWMIIIKTIKEFTQVVTDDSITLKQNSASLYQVTK